MGRRQPPPRKELGFFLTIPAEKLRLQARLSARQHHARIDSAYMLRLLSIGLLASAVATAPLPLKAQDARAEDLGFTSISLKDVVTPRFGLQGALQGSGTPNEAGAGFFLPLRVGQKKCRFSRLSCKCQFRRFQQVHQYAC